MENTKKPMRGPGMRRGNGKKAKNFKEIWKKIFLYSNNYYIPFLFAVLCAVGGTIFTLVGPDKLSEMTKLVAAGMMGQMDIDGISKIGFTLVAFYICSAVLSFSQHFTMTTITQKIVKKMRGDISVKINRLPMSFYNKTSTGDVLSRVTNDIDLIAQSLTQSIGNLANAITLFLGSLFMMLITDVAMTVTAVLATILGFALMMLITGRSQKYFVRQQQDLGALNGQIEEIYSGHTVVKAYNGEAHAKEEFHRMNSDLSESAFRAQCLSGLMMPLMGFIGNLGYVAVCVAGAVLTMNGKIGFEVIVAFMMYVRYFTQPLSQMAQAVQTLQSAGAAGERVFEFLEAEEMPDESEKTKRLEQTKGCVDFEHVSFGYDENKLIIHDFTAHARTGQKIAIVGPTGAGKTTLINLLMRFYETSGGKICIDGIPTSELLARGRPLPVLYGTPGYLAL